MKIWPAFDLKEKCAEDGNMIPKIPLTLTSSFRSFLAFSRSFLFSASIARRTALFGASRVSNFSTHTYDLAVQ